MRPRLLHCPSLCAIACLIVLWHVQDALAQSSPLEYAVKATYLYKFGPFVEWPSQAAAYPAGAFTICVAGNPEVADLLLQVANGQQMNGYPVAVRGFSRITGDPGCSILYAAGPPDAVAADLAAVRGAPVLTVTDSSTSPAPTGMISFVLQDGHVRFDIDPAAARAAGLSISSKLLSLAVHVTGRSP